MKTKILPILVVLTLLITGINAIAIEEANNDNNIIIAETEDSISFSQLKIEPKGEYVSVNLDEANTLLRATGKPILPVYTKTFKFPEGTNIINVDCTISEIKSKVIDGKIEPASEPVRKIAVKNSIVENEDKETTSLEDENIYSSSELFPTEWYNYNIGVGLDKGKDTVFLKINCYPVRYSPAENTLYYTSDFNIHITYEEATEEETFDTEYDLLIITPRRFKLALNSLVRHKNKMGINTKLETTQYIYRNYDGRDNPEKIKLFIRYAKETWNIKYLLLVGGLKSHIWANDKDDNNQGSKAWHVPVRYCNLEDWGYISDLYYADIYKEGNEFEDWDSNGNDIFFDFMDKPDLYPDVYYGRLACRNLYEVRTVIKKIIKYEKTSHKDETWFKRMIAAGGFTFEIHKGQPDGEWLCDLSIDNMGDLIDEPVRIYASNTEGPLPIPKDIIKEFSLGAGFVLFQGHGNAFMWDTQWPGEWGNWTGGVLAQLFPLLKNNRKLPIVVVGGCHNGIFNVSFIKTLFDRDPDHSNYHAYGIPTAWCFSWKIVAIPNGGAISCTGCTDYGIGWMGDPLNLSAMLESNFFYEIGQNDAVYLGDAHSGSIIKYMTDVDISQQFYSHAYAITEYQLFGDPSLKIGGYESPESR